MKTRYVIFKLLLATVFVSSVSGCDMISSIKEHLSKDKKKMVATSTPKPPVVNKQTQPQSPPPQQMAKAETPQKAMPKSMPSKPSDGNFLAKVGNWTITLDEFNERLDALKEVVPDFDAENVDAKKLILEELVRQQLLVEDAERTGVAQDKDIVAAVEEFRRTLLVRESARKITENVEVTEEDAKKFYEEQKEQLVEPSEYRVREIVVKDQIKANEILVDVLKGSDFAELAKLNSIADSKSKGGDLGYITQEPFPAMAQEILALEKGGTSNVFKGPKGFYIIKLEDIRGGKTIPFSEIKEDIIQSQTLLKQQQAILDYIDNVKEKVTVEVREDLLK